MKMANFTMYPQTPIFAMGFVGAYIDVQLNWVYFL